MDTQCSKTQTDEGKLKVPSLKGCSKIGLLYSLLLDTISVDHTSAYIDLNRV